MALCGHRSRLRNVCSWINLPLGEGIIMAETRKLAAILTADMGGRTERLFDDVP
jgi:hypothetical protein